MACRRIDQLRAQFSISCEKPHSLIAAVGINEDVSKISDGYRSIIRFY